MSLSKVPWWLAPHNLILGFIIPIYLICIYSINMNNSNIYIFGAVYLDLYMSITGLILLLCFTVASISSYNFKEVEYKKLNVQLSHLRMRYLDITFYITVIAYLIWFLPFIFHINLLVDLFLGKGYAIYSIRNVIGTISGITTLSQVGILFSCLYSYFIHREIALVRKYHYMFIILLLLTLFRTIAWSERLSIIEFLIPIILAVVMKFHLTSNKKIRKIISIAPYLGTILLIIVFGFFEYFRSWSAFYVNKYDSYLNFIIERLSSYYLVALNNGAGLVIENNGFHLPIYSFDWAFKFPVLGDVLRNYLEYENSTSYFLERFANEELNNMSAIFTLYYEFKYVSFLLMIVLGWYAGILYKQFRQKYFFSSLIYPLMFISCLELLRIHYFISNRTIPVLIIIVGFVIYESLISRKII